MSEDKFKLDTIESAIRDIRDGKVVIVVDDKNRENEGDFLAAAELITPEIINFMATHGRGLICAPITENISKRLGLNLSTFRKIKSDEARYYLTDVWDVKNKDWYKKMREEDKLKTLRKLKSLN